MVNIAQIDKFRSARILERVAGTALPGRCGPSGRGRSGLGQYCRVLAIFAALACAFVALRSDPAVAQTCAVNEATKNWKSVVLRLAVGSGGATDLGPVSYSPESIPDTGVIELSASIVFSRLVLSEATVAIRDMDLANFSASFGDDNNFVIPALVNSKPFFRYQAEFKNADGAVLHRAVQCSVSAGEVEGYESFANLGPNTQAGAGFMCDWPVDGSTPDGETATLSLYFEQQPSMNVNVAAQTALSLRTPGTNTNLGQSLTDTGEYLLNLKPRGDGDDLPASVVFSLTGWSGEVTVIRFSGGCEGFLTLPLDEQAFDRTSESLLTFGEEAPRLTTLDIAADQPTRDHPDTLGQDVEFMITLGPEYSDGAGEGTAMVDLQLDPAANAAFLSGEGLVVSEQDGSRASIRLSTRTTVIRVAVTPDTRSDTTVTLTAVANEDGSSLGSLVLTVLAPDNGPASLFMFLADDRLRTDNPLVLDAEGRAEAQLFIQVFDARGQGIAVDLAGELILELDGLSGPLLQVRVLSDDPSRLLSVAAGGDFFDVVFSAPPNLFTTVTLVAEGYKDLRGSRLPLQFERAAETRLVSGNRLSVGTDVLCGLTELGTVRCGGQDGLNGGDRDSRSGGQGSYRYEVFEVSEAVAPGQPMKSLSGVVALGQSLSSPPVSCALLGDGDVACWGESGTSFAGTTISRTAKRIAGLSNVLQLSMGSDFACALVAVTGDEGGTEIYCWGNNSFGQAGSSGSSETPRLATRLGSLKGVIQLAAGATHACALQLDGRVFCWGENGTGKLLLGSGSLDASTEPVEMAVSNVVQIAAGGLFSCALSRSGDKDSVGCWGGNYSTDPILDGLVSRVSPIAGLATASGARLRQLTVAGRQGCALVDTGEQWCWRNHATAGGGTDSRIYGNDFDVGGERQALCFSEAGATVPCLGRDTVLQCLEDDQSLDDVLSGQCDLLPEPRSSGRLLTLVADTVERLLRHAAVNFDARGLGIAAACGQADQSCISQRIMQLTEALNSPPDNDSNNEDLRESLLRFYVENNANNALPRRQARVPLYTIARQLVRAEDSLYYPRSSTDAITAGVGPLTAVLEMRLFANSGGTENGGCALRRDSSLWCWGASSIGPNISLSGHGFWTAGETEAQFVVDLADENARQLGYRYAVSIVPWDISPNAVRVWTEIGIDFLLGADEQLLELEAKGEQYAVTVPIRISVLAGPPDASGELRPLPFADIEIAAVEELSVPDGVRLEFNPMLLSPFQIGSTAVVESTMRVWFEESYGRDSATIELRFPPVIAEPDVSADQASLLVALQVGLLGGLSLELVSGSTANWSVTEQRSFKVRLRATDRFGNIFNPPANSLLLDVAHPPEISFDGIIGGDIITFSGGLSSRTLRFTRLDNADSSIILTASPNTTTGQPYADSNIRAMLSIAVAKTEVSRFQVSFDVTRQQLEADGPAEFSVSVVSLDANGLPLIGPLNQTTGLTLQVTLTDNAGGEYIVESEVLVFADGKATSSFTVTLSGYDATQLAAELSGTMLPLEVIADGFELIAVERLLSLGLAVNPLAKQQQAFGQPLTFTITVQSVGTKGGQPNPLNAIRLNADFDSTALSWGQLGGDAPFSFTDGTAVVDVMVTPLQHCTSDPCLPESLEFFVSGAATEVTSNRASVEVTPAPVLASVTIAPISQSQLPEAYQGAPVIVEERIVINSSGTDGGPFAPSGLSLRLVGTNLRIAGGGTTLSLSFDAAGRAMADISHLRLFVVDEQSGDSTLNLDVIGAPTRPVEVSIIAVDTTITVLAAQRIATLSVTFSAPQLLGSRWGQVNSGDPLALSVEIRAYAPGGAAISPVGLVLRINGTGITPARQDMPLDFVNGRTQADVTVNLAEQGKDGSLRAVLLFGDSPVANVAVPAIELQVPERINLVAVELVDEVDWSNNRNIFIPIGELDQPKTITRAIYLRGTKADTNSLDPARGLPWSSPDTLTYEVEGTTVSFVLPDNAGGGGQSLSFVLLPQYFPDPSGSRRRTLQQRVSGVVNGKSISTRRPLFLETAILLLSGLTISFDAPEQYEQSEAGEPISVRLSIQATRSGGEPYPGSGQQLRLRLQGSNIAGSEFSVPLPANGEGVVEFEVNLAQQGIDGVIGSLEVIGTPAQSGGAVIVALQTTATLVAQEILASAMVTAQPAQVEQTEAGGMLSFTVGVSEAVGSKGTLWESEDLSLGVSGDNVVATSSSLSIVGGTATTLTVTVSLANPNEDGTAQFALLSDSEYLDAALVLTQEPAEGVALIALPVLREVRIAVENQPPMFVLSSTAAISIQLRVTADYLAKRSTTTLTVMVTGLTESLSWPVTIPRDETSVSMEQSVQLGALRQATLRFAAVGLAPGVAVISNDEVVVSLVPSSLELRLSPPDVQELAPRDETTAEIRVTVRALDAEGGAFDGLSDLIVQTTVTAVADGQRSDVSFSASAVEETLPGVYESTLTVTLSANQISEASLRLEVAGVAGENLRPAAVADISLARQVTLDSLALSLANDVLEQSALGTSVQTTATVEARDQFGEPFSPDSLQLRVVAIGGSEVLVTPALDFDAQGEAQSVLTLTPPRGRDQSLRVEVTGVTDPAVSSNTVTLELMAVEALASLTVTIPASTLTQTMRDQAVDFELTVTAAGSKGTEQFQPTEILELQYVADRDDVMVDYEPLLIFNAGVATVTVSVTPVPGIDARVTFDNVGGAFRDVVIIPAELAVIAAEVLSTVALTVSGDLSRIVRSGQEEILITVELEAEYLGENIPAQTVLQLRAMGTNGVEDSAPVDVVVPTGGSMTAELSLMLGIARQTTVSFEVVGLPAEANLISQEVRVELVPVAALLAISVLPQAMLELDPRADVTAEFGVIVNVWGSDGQLFGGLSDLLLDTTVTAVADGDAGDLAFLSAALEESAAGVYGSALRVTIGAGQVSMASVKITVADGGTSGLASVSTTVQLVRRVTLDSLMLSLVDSELRQAEAGASVQTTATVVALDQFERPFSPTELQLRVVATADETEVLVTTPELVFDVQGQAQSVLTLIPPRGMDQNLRVEVIGVTDPEVSTSTVALSLIAVEVLGSLTVAVPASQLTQTMPAEAVVFDVTVTAVGTKDTPFQPTGLALQHVTDPDVVVDYEPGLSFSAGVATVTVSVTPVPGTNTDVNFRVMGTADVLEGVVPIPAEVNIIAAEVLSTVTLTVSGDLSRIVRSGQEEILITVELEAEYLGENILAQTVLQLRAMGTNGVVDSAPVDVVVPAGGPMTAELSLMLGTARQTTVSFEVVGLPAEANLISQEVRVELVPVPALLAISVLPQAMLELDPSADVTAEFGVIVNVWGSDGQLFGGLSDLVLDTTVTAVADGEQGDLTLSLSADLLAESAAGVYGSTLRVTITAGQVSMASVEITVADGGTSGLASVSTTVQLVRRVVLESLMLSLADGVLAQSAPDASVQSTATVTALDQFGRPFSPTELQLRVVDTAGETEVLVTTPTLVFDAQGQAQSVLSLTPPPGINQGLRVELVGVTDTDVSINTVDLEIVAAEALGRVILMVEGGSEQFVSSRTFSITLKLSLERAGDRPLTAATVWMAQLRASIVGGTLVGGPNFAVSVSGASTSSVVITGMFASNALLATISLSAVDGVPAVPVDILPANTVEINLGADLDVDGNTVFDVMDAVLLLSAASNSLPASLSEEVRDRLEEVLSPDNPGMRLDVDGNGTVEPIDVRVLLRYLAGLRGDSLMEGAADTAAIEQRARDLLDPN